MRPTALPVDRHATEQARALLAHLRPQLAGEARFDLYTRALYATDASIFQVMPLGVVMPRVAEDVHAVLEAARQFRVPILARGSGSSLEGQTTGPGLVLDFSKFMHRLVAVDAEARTARIQPGIVLDALNRQLAPHGLMFGPDPASSNRATLGGMIGNNSTGAHSILYGMTHDHVRSLRVLTADGVERTLGPLNGAGLQQKLTQQGAEGDLYRLAVGLADTQQAEIEARWPRHWRSVSGYGLNRMLAREPFNLAHLLVGSEGTLALTLDAEVALVSRPTQTALAVLHFATLDGAMEAVTEILALDPSAIELIDDVMISLTRAVPDYARHLTFIEGTPACVLIVEFYGESDAELATKLDRLDAQSQRLGLGYATVRATTAAQIAAVWYVRKAGLGLLMSTTSPWKPIAFIEDGSVPPAMLPEFVRGVQQILDAHQTKAAIYAHASAGCLHIRPMLNLKRGEEVERMRQITRAWCDLIVSLRGSFSGEHGDGRARTEWNERLFGPQLYEAFCQLKDGWDPDGLLNPGSVVRGQRMTENLRYGAAYNAPDPFAGERMLAFERNGGFVPAVEQCSGVGVCRKTDEGVMCPSYMATRDEEHSTRGRANALRAALSGVIPRDQLLSERMHAVLDLCLECKACAAECPTGVDMAKIKYEYLYHYHQKHGQPARNRLFGNIRRLNQLGSAAAPLANRIAQSAFARRAQSRLGIAPARTLPPFARTNFYAWWKAHQRGKVARNGDLVGAHGSSWELDHSPTRGRNSQLATRNSAVLFPDTFTLYNYPDMGIAAVRLMEAAGYEVIVPEGLGCCGRPQISKGMLEEAKGGIERVVERLLPYAEQGLPILGIEPSCLLTFRDEAIELLRSDAARTVAAQCQLVDEWLVARVAAGEAELHWKATPRTLLLHGHCHHKAHGISPALEALRLPPSYTATLIDAGCCGMAGAFGYEAEHYDLSQRIGEDRLFPALRAAPDAEIAVTGISCRQQIEHFTGRRARHVVEWLAEALL